MMSSMDVSPWPRAVIGTSTAIGLAVVNGCDLSLQTGSGTVGWIGLCSSSGSHPGINGSLFDKSVNISKKQHQDGGFTDPLNDSFRQMYAHVPDTSIVSSAVFAMCGILWYTSEKSYLLMNNFSVGNQMQSATMK